MVYILTPFVAWSVTGIIKLIVNSIQSQKLAFHLIGYGGWPSNHSSIVSSTATLIALKEGINQPAFGIAITLVFIVILDAVSLRRQVGQQAAVLNQLLDKPLMRERIGHKPNEVVAGLIVGTIVAIIIVKITP